MVSSGGTPNINLQRGTSALGNWKITAKGNGSQQVLATSVDTSDLMTVQADGKVGIGTATPGGALDISSTSGALILPRMTTAQRNAIPTTRGSIIFDDTLNHFFGYNGTSWVQLSP